MTDFLLRFMVGVGIGIFAASLFIYLTDTKIDSIAQAARAAGWGIGFCIGWIFGLPMGIYHLVRRFLRRSPSK